MANQFRIRTFYKSGGSRVARIISGLVLDQVTASLPIAMLETLLLLSCRDLGVDFVLIDNDNDENDDKKKHVAMEKIMCEVDIAFDATGNQFSMNEPVSESIDEKKKQYTSINTLD